MTKRKKDTGESGNGGQWASEDRAESDVEIPAWSDDSLDWNRGEIDWNYAGSEQTVYYDSGQVAERVLLDGTVEHYDEDGTFSHVVMPDGSITLIHDDDDHPYIAHRKFVEYAFETHELSPVQAEARFIELSPQLASHDSENARRLGRGIADAVANDELYRAEELCESAAQQHSLTAWLQKSHRLPAESDANSVPTQTEARTEAQRLDRHFVADRSAGLLPPRLGCVPMTFVDSDGTSHVVVDIIGAPDSLSRDTSEDVDSRRLTPAMAEAIERVHESARRCGVEVQDVRVESELRAAERRLRTYEPREALPGLW